MARGKRQRVLGGGGGIPPRRPLSFPLPTALDPGRDWTIREGRGSVMRSPGAGVLDVPLGQSDRDRAVRLHELAHVKWTPIACPGVEGIPWGTVNACEDGRIHKRLDENGLLDESSAVLDVPGYERIRAGVEQGTITPLDAARLLIASIRTADEHPVRRAIEAGGAGWAGAIATRLYQKHFGPRRPAWKTTAALAHELEDVFQTLPDEIPDETIREGIERPDHDSGSGAGWGEMSIETPPLVIGMPRGMMAPRRRATDTGAVPRNWHRLNTDGRVFTRNRRRPCGGAVLLDQSGSMSLTADDVQEIIQLYPGVIVAGYAGDHSRGVLRIIARNGKRAADHDCRIDLGGNTVDGPALRWLAEQPGPRVWISDGGIVGADGDQSPGLYADVAAITAAANIKRIDNVQSIIRDERGN